MPEDTPTPIEQYSPLSAGEVALGSLIEAAHTLHPDDVAAEVARRASMVGIVDTALLVVDRQQNVLSKFDDPDAEPLSINSTLAGRAYRTGEVVLSEPTTDPRQARRAYFPMLDGAERTGVMVCDLRAVDAVTLGRCRQLAALAAHLVVSKRDVGDGPVLRQRVQEMDVSAELRWALMPPLTFATSSVVVAGALEPAYDVAGDTFDYAANGDTLHVAVFDAMGHGLSASRMANLAVISYRNARRKSLGLVETAEFVHDVIVSQLGETTGFVTAQFARLSMADGRAEILNCGHPRPLLVRGMRAVSEVQCERGLPLGVGTSVDVHETSLEPGDGLLFYSDGVTEARAPDGEEFGLDRLADMLVRAAASGETAPELMRRLTHAVLEHQQGRLDDDATLLLVRWRG